MLSSRYKLKVQSSMLKTINELSALNLQL